MNSAREKGSAELESMPMNRLLKLKQIWIKNGRRR